MVNLVSSGEDADKFVDKFSPVIGGEDVGDSMTADDFIIDERCDVLGIGGFECSGFNPFGEVVDGYYDVALSSGGER